MAYVEVAKVGDVPPGTMKAVTAAGKQVLIVNHDGAIYAMARVCSHMGGDLAKGTLQGATVRCPRHGSQFDVRTGAALAGPKIGPLKMSTKALAVYAVKIEGDAIIVDVG